MDKQPNIRRLTVSSYHPDHSDKAVPYLRLKGKWLEQAGFSPGSFVKVFIGQEGLTIRPDMERSQALRSEIKVLESRLAVLKEQEAYYG